MKQHHLAILLVITTSLLVPAIVYAQLKYTPDTTEEPNTEFVQGTVTHPTNDAVLKLAPQSITLSFPEPAILMKLSLKDGEDGWKNIDFRFNPEPKAEYTWLLPELNQASFYTLEWAALPMSAKHAMSAKHGDGSKLGRKNEVESSSFSFAFGPGAEPPSSSKEAESLLRELQNSDLNQRYAPLQLDHNHDDYDHDH